MLPLLAVAAVAQALSADARRSLQQQLLIERANATAIDRISHVEMGPTQMIVTTSKHGPVEGLQIRMELTDMEERRVLAPISLQGLFLLVSRGQYTIPFLKPDHFYGLYFESSNTIDGRRLFHNETRILRTAARAGGRSTNNFVDPKFELTVHRDDELGELNTEGVFVTAKWTQQNRLNDSAVVFNVDVLCDHTTASEVVVLDDSDDGVTIEIAMDHQIEIQGVDESTHQILAHITPLKICWNATYVLMILSRNFTREFNTTCEELKPMNRTAFIRQLKSYALSDSTLFIHTELLGSEDDNAIVTLQAQDLAHPEESPLLQDTSTSPNGSFAMALAENTAYAVTFIYARRKPFRYTTSDRFLVETFSHGFNTTASQPELVDLILENSTIVIPQSNSQLEMPSVFIAKHASFESLPTMLIFDPFCGRSVVNSSQIVLPPSSAPIELQLPLLEALCAKNDSWPVCANVSGACASSALCFTPTAVSGRDLFKGSRRCIDVLDRLELQFQASAATNHFLVLVTVFVLAR